MHPLVARGLEFWERCVTEDLYRWLGIEASVYVHEGKISLDQVERIIAESPEAFARELYQLVPPRRTKDGKHFVWFKIHLRTEYGINWEREWGRDLRRRS